MKKKPEDVEEFFWGHLRKDMVYLAEALGRNTEEAMLTVHLFLQHLSKDSPAGRELLGSSGRSPSGWWGLDLNSVTGSPFLGQPPSQKTGEKMRRTMRAGSSSTAFRPEQLEGMSRLGDSLLQAGICVIPPAPGSSCFYSILLLTVKKPSSALGEAQGLQVKAHKFLLQMRVEL